jgi:hypothetical protein
MSCLFRRLFAAAGFTLSSARHTPSGLGGAKASRTDGRSDGFTIAT